MYGAQCYSHAPWTPVRTLVLPSWVIVFCPNRRARMFDACIAYVRFIPTRPGRPRMHLPSFMTWTQLLRILEAHICITPMMICGQSKMYLGACGCTIFA